MGSVLFIALFFCVVLFGFIRLRHVSYCVPYVARFSGLYILDFPFGFSNIYLSYRSQQGFVINKYVYPNKYANSIEQRTLHTHTISVHTQIWKDIKKNQDKFHLFINQVNKQFIVIKNKYCESEPRWWRDVLDTTLCDKVLSVTCDKSVVFTGYSLQ